MKAIHRYSVTSHITQIILHKDAEVVHFDYQEERGTASLWVIEDDAHETHKRTFKVLPTGAFVEDNFKYLKTMNMDGFHIFHLFEVNSIDVHAHCTANTREPLNGTPVRCMRIMGHEGLHRYLCNGSIIEFPNSSAWFPHYAKENLR